MYDVLLVLHLLGAILVVGPLALSAVHSPGQARRGDVLGLQAAHTTTRVYSAATALVVALGAVMTADRFEKTATWVLASYALWFVAVLLHVLVVGKAQEAALAALSEGRDVGGLPGRIAVGGGLATLCWAAIVVLMVYKP